MDYSTRLDISYYENITPINEDHHIYLVKHRGTGQIAVKKELSVYNAEIYLYLKNHPVNGIPKIYAIHEEDDTLTVIEEFLSGETLERRLENPTPLFKDDVNLIMHSLCKILSSLHKAVPPIVHRDIKPSNIIITSDKRIFLVDYNAAKYCDSTSNEDTTLLGTKGYAAPEQYGFGSSTPKTDIYALGIVLKKILEHTPSLKSQFEHIADKCSRIDPNDRYSSVKDLDKALSRRLDYTPPGFREKKPWHMIVSVPIYALFAWFSFTLEYKDMAPASVPFLRTCTFLWLIGLVLLCCNYLDVHRYLPPCNNSNNLLRIFGIALWCIIFTAVVFLFMCFISILLFNN